MKVGIEVEGKHLGMKTLFCSRDELIEWKKMCSIIMANLDIDQVYISDHENMLNLNIDPLLMSLLTTVKMVTVERTYVPEYVHRGIDVMLLINNSSFWNLRGQDQIKFSEDLYVHSIMKDDMVKTVPSDFDGDIEV
jgi:hypothetical protein